MFLIGSFLFVFLVLAGIFYWKVIRPVDEFAEEYIKNSYGSCLNQCHSKDKRNF